MLKFSIVTSCFNAEKYIAETIESVVKQTDLIEGNCELEYIIIDGDSTDNTNLIIKNYKNLYPQITHIIEKDEGLYDGLAKGFELITGDVMGYLNAGDFFNKTAFSVLRKVFLNKTINWVTGFKVLYNQQSEITSFQIPYKYRSNLIRSGVYGKYLPFIQQESTFWRPILLKEVDISYLKSLQKSGDMYLWYCFAKNNKLNIINSYLSGFKYHDNQLTFRETGSTDIYLEEAKEFIEKKNIKDFFFIFLDSLPWFLGRNLSSIYKLINAKHIDYLKIENNWNFQKRISKKTELVCWVCDFRQTNGEGIIANMFLKDFVNEKNISNEKIYIRNLFYKTYYSKIDNMNNIENMNLTFTEKYISPFIGIFYLWYSFLRGRKICYLNFLPLWNFIIFLLLPPNTILGPITGSKHYDEENVTGFEKFFRKYLMNIQFRISNFILNFRHNNLTFSTRNLEDLLSEKVKKKSKFDYMHKLYESPEIYNSLNGITNTDIKKDIDFIIYIRFYPSKGTKILVEYIKKLRSKYKIVTVGDKCGVDGIEEFGTIDRKDVLKLCQRSRFSIASSENFYSFFSYDCIHNNTKVFFSNQNKFDKELEKKQKIFPIDIYKIEESVNYIENIAHKLN